MSGNGREATLDLSSVQAALVDLARGEATSRRQGKPLYLCPPFVSSSLVQGKFKVICQCPPHVDQAEWIATSLIDMYNQLNSFFSVVSTACTAESCKEMSIGPDFNVYWRDARERPAFTYIDSTLSWIQGLLDNKTVFPTESGRDFPTEFIAIAKRIYLQMLNLFSHLYHAHFDAMLHLKLESHFNSLTAHFLVLGLINGLVERDCRELNARSRKGLVMGTLLSAWEELDIVKV